MNFLLSRNEINKIKNLKLCNSFLQKQYRIQNPALKKLLKNGPINLKFDLNIREKVENSMV